MSDFNRAIALNPKEDLAYHNRAGFKQLYLNDLSGALADYDRAIFLLQSQTLSEQKAASLRHAKAYNNRGTLKQFKLQDISGALADYNKAIGLEPQQNLAYHNRAGLKKNNLNDISGALTDYNKAIELNPKNATAYFNRGLCKEIKRDLTGSIQDFQQAAKIFRSQGKTNTLQIVIRKLKELGATE